MKKLSILVLAMLMTLGMSSMASAAPMLTVGLDFYGGDTAYTQGDIDTKVKLFVGQSVMVDFVYSIEDPDTPGIGLWKAGFNLDFNPATLQASNYQEYGDRDALTGWLSYEGNGSGITDGNVKFRGQEQSFLNPSEGRIIGFELTCLEVGVDDIIFLDWGSGPDWAIDIVHGGTTIDDTIVFGPLATVNNVPIPGAVWLLGSGLIGLIGLRRKN